MTQSILYLWYEPWDKLIAALTQAAAPPAPAPGQEPLLWLPVLGAGQRQPGGRARAARHQLRRHQAGAHSHPRMQVGHRGDSLRWSDTAVHSIRGVYGPF